MKKQSEKSQEGGKVTLENIQGTITTIKAFCGQAKASHQRESDIDITHTKGQDANYDATSENGFGCIAKHITEIKLPSFSKREFILAKEDFSVEDKAIYPYKYNIEFGYLREVEEIYTKSLNIYTEPHLLNLAKDSCFSSYITLRYNKPEETTISFTLVEYDDNIYLCYDDTWIFCHNASKIIAHPEHQTVENGLTPELYMQKYNKLRDMIQREASASRKEKNKSPEIADILKNLQF